MHKENMKDKFIENLEKGRVKQGLTQQQMADKLEMSLPGYRKMVSGNTEIVDLCKAYKASNILNIPLSILCGSENIRDRITNELYHSSDGMCSRIDYYLEYSKKVHNAVSNTTTEGRVIDVLTMQGYMTDGMQMNSRNIEKKIIPNKYGNRAVKGVIITEHSFLPVYTKGDVVLLEETTSRHGDICMVIHLPSQRLYLRKLIFGECFELHPITNRGDVIYIPHSERSDWFDYGHVIGYVKEEELIDIPIDD